MNIIHIISDTFRRDNLSHYGGKGFSPSLDAFAEKCVVFNKAYVCSYPTVPIRGELVTGQVGFCRRGWEPLKRDVPVIATALTDAGIVSMMIADTPHHLNNGFFYNRGFTGWDWIRGQESDQLYTQPFDFDSAEAMKYRRYTRPHPEQLPAGLTNHLRNTAFRQHETDTYVSMTMRKACDWLERNYQHENFYLMVDTFDPHEPWDAPDWYVRRFDPGDYDGPEPIYPPYGPNIMDERSTQRLNALYRAEACLVDNWIGHLLRKIEYMGLMENTMIIFMADHGFLLGEHDLIAKNYSMYEEVVHIPLFIYHPDAAPRHTDALVSIADIPATVVDFFGAEWGEQVEGLSLLPTVLDDTDRVRDYAITHGAWVGGWSPDGGKPHGHVTDGTWSLLLENEGPPNKLFHLPSDPAQAQNRFESDTDEAHRLYSAFLEFITQHGGTSEMVEAFRRRFQA
jgi:arylsulfatase A-like enzyme